VRASGGGGEYDGSGKLVTSEESVPAVFISYSHDNPDHKRWVLDLAATLRRNGVDVVIDAWDLRPGDDIPKFMERGVRGANRVLMICTEQYVAKCNDGIGGVGYEAMIVTGELIRDLGTAKFIPVIRQFAMPPLLPASVSTRFYLDMSDTDREAGELEKLLRELHGAPLLEKPALGANPFRAEPSAQPPAAGEMESVGSFLKGSTINDPIAAYELALQVAKVGDVANWRSVVRRARDGMVATLESWWKTYGTERPVSVELIIEQSLEGAVAFAPLMAIAIAGVSSGNAKFRNHAGLLEDILNPSEWQRSGYVARVELPELGGYLLQAVHGAFAIHAGDVSLAMSFALTPTTNKQGDRIPVWRRHDLTGWPESLGKNATASWKTLFDLAERWPWVKDIFGDVLSYQEALLAYYMALGLLEYMELLRAGNVPPVDAPQNMYVDIPPVYEVASPEAKRRAYRILIDSGLKEWLVSTGVDPASIRRHWRAWIAVQKFWHHQLYPFSRGEMANERLIPDLLGD
jgi:hypothetical protein